MFSTRRQFLQTSILMSLGLTQLTGCSQLPPLKIARHIWPGYEFLYFAEKAGFYDGTGVEFLDTNSASESMAALLSGEVDGAALTLDEVLLCLDKGADLTIALVFDISSGADVVVSKPEINTIQQLKGKRIGVEVTALGNLILSKLLDQAGLVNDDVTVVFSTIDHHMTSWEKGDLDAIITYEPVASQLIKKGGKRLFDSRKMPDTIFDVLAVRTERIFSDQKRVCDVINGHFYGLDAFIKNPVDTAYRLAERMNLNGSEVLSAYHGLNLPTSTANHQLLAKDGRIKKVAHELSELMLQQQMLSKPVKLDKLTTTVCLSGA